MRKIYFKGLDGLGGDTVAVVGRGQHAKVNKILYFKTFMMEVHFSILGRSQ
jgi:hypothetical protein